MSNIIFSTEPSEFTEFFISRFAQLSDGKYTIEQGNANKIHKEYYEVYESLGKEKWKECRFHFEIRWSGNIPLQEAKEVRVAVHVERTCDSKAPELTGQIRTAFSDRLQRNTIISEPVTVDHSSEESTVSSIGCILKVIESYDFQCIADKAKEIIGAD